MIAPVVMPMAPPTTAPTGPPTRAPVVAPATVPVVVASGSSAWTEVAKVAPASRAVAITTVFIIFSLRYQWIGYVRQMPGFGHWFRQKFDWRDGTITVKPHGRRRKYGT